MKIPLTSLRTLCGIISIMFVGGCASYDVANLRVNMTKEEVTAAMGKATATTIIEQTEYWEYNIAAEDSRNTQRVNPSERPFSSPNRLRTDAELRTTAPDGSYEDRRIGVARRERYMVVFKNDRAVAHGSGMIVSPQFHNRPNSPSNVPFVIITRLPRGKFAAQRNTEYSAIVVYALPANITHGRVEMGYVKEKAEITLASQNVDSSRGQVTLAIKIPGEELGKLKELRIFARLQRQSEKDKGEFKTVATAHMGIPASNR